MPSDARSLKAADCSLRIADLRNSPGASQIVLTLIDTPLESRS
jgi:hypothetical protein